MVGARARGGKGAGGGAGVRDAGRRDSCLWGCVCVRWGEAGREGGREGVTESYLEEGGRGLLLVVARPAADARAARMDV